MNLQQWLQLLFLSVLWGCSFIFMEVALADLPILTIVAGRVFCAALALAGLMIVSGRTLMLGRKIWGRLFISSMFGIVIPFYLIVWAQMSITASMASVLNGTMPFFSVILAHFLTRDERLKVHRFGGVLLGFCGVAVIMGADQWLHGKGTLSGQAAMLCSSLCYAWMTLFRRGFSGSGIRPLEASAGEMILASAVLCPAALILDRIWLLPAPGMGAIGAVAGLGLLSTALAFVIYHALLPKVGANNMSLVTFLIPVSAIAMGVAFLGEILTLSQIAGMAVIACGLAFIDGRFFRIFRLR